MTAERSEGAESSRSFASNDSASSSRRHLNHRVERRLAAGKIEQVDRGVGQYGRTASQCIEPWPAVAHPYGAWPVCDR